jgi:hypothetical protein
MGKETAFSDKATPVTGSGSGMGAATVETLPSWTIIATVRYEGAILDFVTLDTLRESRAAEASIDQETAALHTALRTDWGTAMD